MSTLKRLFALSGNICAFPKCPTELVHERTVTGEVCHIRGRKPDAPRYDDSQSDDERHSFENLILLCPLHHSIVDADEVAYTVSRLDAMKAEHERTSRTVTEPQDEVALQFIANVQNVKSYNQAGGITANVVHIGVAPPAPRFNRQRLERWLKEIPQLSVHLANGLWEAPSASSPPTRWEPQWPVRVASRGDDSFEVRVPRGSVFTEMVPYDLVDAAWLTSDMKLGLRLRGRLVLRSSGLRFETDD